MKKFLLILIFILALYFLMPFISDLMNYKIINRYTYLDLKTIKQGENFKTAYFKIYYPKKERRIINSKEAFYEISKFGASCDEAEILDIQKGRVYSKNNELLTEFDEEFKPNKAYGPYSAFTNGDVYYFAICDNKQN